MLNGTHEQGTLKDCFPLSVQESVQNTDYPDLALPWV